MVNNKFKIAAILMIIHGALMEAGTGIFMMPFALKHLTNGKISEYIFAIDMFRDNILFMIPMAIVFGVTRVIGAIGLLKNRKWGFVLSVINCVVTMIIMIFMIPSGITDGLLSCSALVLLLAGYYGTETIK